MLTLLIALWSLSGLLANFYVIRLFLGDKEPLGFETVSLAVVLGPITVVLAVVFITYKKLGHQ